MPTSEYTLLPRGRTLMIIVLIFLFFVFFMTGPLWVYPINLLLGLFTTFRVGTGFFVRGAVAIFLSMLSMSLLLEAVYDKIGWYRLELDGDKTLRLIYRSSLTDTYQSVDFHLRYTMIEEVTEPLWLISTDPKISVIVGRPDEKEDEPFFDRLYELIEQWQYKVREEFREVSLGDYEHHYIFTEGSIKKLSTTEFTRVSGITRIDYDYYVGESEDSFLDASGIVDYYEYEQTMNDAPGVDTLEPADD